MGVLSKESALPTFAVIVAIRSEAPVPVVVYEST
jgi:hypothetical protein